MTEEHFKMYKDLYNWLKNDLLFKVNTSTKGNVDSFKHEDLNYLLEFLCDDNEHKITIKSIIFQTLDSNPLFLSENDFEPMSIDKFKEVVIWHLKGLRGIKILALQNEINNLLSIKL